MDDRYSRQVFFEPIGKVGQQRLAETRVSLIGCGALGSHIAQHLARAGVGYLRLADRDFVELNNLQRQVLFDESDVEQQLPKAVAAADKLSRVNSTIDLEPRVLDVTAGNVRSLVADVDIVVDGTDNFATRYLLNDACVEAARAWVYGGCVGSHGMVLAIIPGETPCFSCFLPEMPEAGSTPTCDTAGVIGPAVAVVAALQVSEVLKLAVGDRAALSPGLTTIDVWRNAHRILKLERNPECPTCGQRDFRHLRSVDGELASRLCGRDAVQISPGRPARIDLEELSRRLESLGPVHRNDYLLRFSREDLEITLFPDGRAVIKGTDEPARARAAYAKYVGS